MDGVSEAEWRVRCELAACYRLFVTFGWTDLIFTHLSARAPGEPERYLINPYGLLFEEITASKLIKVDFDGTVVAGDYPYNSAGHAIHTAVLRARPDVTVALHSHTRAGSAVSAMREGLLPLSQQAMEIMGLVCRHPYHYAPDSAEECTRLGRDLGDKWLMIMDNHGLLSVGRSVAEAFYLLYTLENACKIQVDVMAAGAEKMLPSAEAQRSLSKYTAISPDGPQEYMDVAWAALLRKLERDGVDWRV